MVFLLNQVPIRYALQAGLGLNIKDLVWREGIMPPDQAPMIPIFIVVTLPKLE